MKKILYSLLAGAMILSSCSKESDSLATIGSETTFTLSVAELQSRATSTVTPTRYIMEVWSEDGTQLQEVIKKSDGTLTSHLEVGSASSVSFTATFDKTKTYTCLFWADGSAADDQAGTYNAASLKAVTLNSGKTADECYYAKVDIAQGKKPAVAVSLKRAVAKVTLVETDQVEAGKAIVVSYDNNTMFNTFDGTAGTPETGYTYTVTTAADKLSGALGELYMLSPAGGETKDMTLRYATASAISLTNVPVRQNYNTNIKGEFSNYIFTVTTDEVWGTPENDFDFKWANTMQFTIDLTASDLTFIIPFAEEGTTPADLTIDWGDGNSTSIVQNTDLSTQVTGEALTHAYGGEGTYQISITSAAFFTQTQIPAFNFGLYRMANDNSVKLKSMDSPMLNMGIIDLSGCFAGCSGLTQIPEKLFAKNTEVKGFISCFSGCIGLLAIPEKLFEQNTKVTSFEDCFGDCESLMEIPEKLFEKNEAVESFYGCFAGCSTLSAIPEKLFEKNTAVTSFKGCFDTCEGLMEIPAKLFEKNTEVTSFAECFYNCIELKEIPNGLFATNKAVGYFSHCFHNCPKAKLNPNIFCDEATESQSRFAGKKMAFADCFKDCGSTLAAGEGGTAPALWSYSMTLNSYNGCFDGTTAVTNVDDIPIDWKKHN